MKKNLNNEQSPREILMTFLDERITSCERKRKSNLIFMNALKLIRSVSAVLAVLFVALLAAEGFNDEFKFFLNIAAILCTSLVALSSEISSAFGFENRFKQNVQASGRLRSMKSKLQLQLTLLNPAEDFDYIGYHDKILDVLNGQSREFSDAFDKAHKEK